VSRWEEEAAAAAEEEEAKTRSLKKER